MLVFGEVCVGAIHLVNLVGTHINLEERAFYILKYLCRLNLLFLFYILLLLLNS